VRSLSVSSLSDRTVYLAGGYSKLQNELRTVAAGSHPFQLSWPGVWSFHSADVAVGADTAYIMYARGATVIRSRPLAAAAGSDYGQVGVTSLQSSTHKVRQTEGRLERGRGSPSLRIPCCQLNPSKRASGLFCPPTRNRW